MIEEERKRNLTRTLFIICCIIAIVLWFEYLYLEQQAAEQRAAEIRAAEIQAAEQQAAEQQAAENQAGEHQPGDSQSGDNQAGEHQPGDQTEITGPQTPTAPGADTVSIYILDVGEALSVFIDAMEVEVLIDAGNARDGKYISKYIQPLVDGDLEYVIATHAHADHVGGLAQIYADYQVNETIYGDLGHAKFEEAARNEPDSTFRISENETLDLIDGVTLTTIDVMSADRNHNNNSIVSIIDIYGTRVLVTGDAEKKVEKLMLGMVGDVDIYVVGHHGSETSSSQAFLDEIKPEYGLISSEGPGGKYRNPDEEVLRRLLDSGADVYATYRSGEIIITIRDGGFALSPPESERLTLENYTMKEAA